MPKNFMNEILKNLIDSLNRFLLVLLLILVIVTFFVRSFTLDLIKILVLIVIIFRLTSKNKLKRSIENDKYLKLKKTLLNPFNNVIRNIKDKDHVYKKCRRCKTILKLPLPSKRGIQHAKCPSCKKRVTFFTLKKEKVVVEVIKKR